MDIISQYLFKLDDKYYIISNIDYGYLMNDYHFHYNFELFMKIFSFYQLDINNSIANIIVIKLFVFSINKKNLNQFSSPWAPCISF